MRAAQQALLAQAHSAGALATALIAKGFLAQQGQAPGEVFVDDKRGKRSRILIDSHGRLSQVVSPLDRSHRLFYDDQHRVTGLVEPNGLTTQLTYTATGELAALSRDEQRWAFAWDADSDLIKATLPDGTRTQRAIRARNSFKARLAAQRRRFASNAPMQGSRLR